MTNSVIPVPADFSLKATIFSHGWVDLLPFRLDQQNLQLNYRFAGPVGPCEFTVLRQNGNELEVASEGDPATVTATVQRVLRLDEDYSDFYRMARAHKNYQWIQRTGAGRMTRSATLWEDMVKMLCTTNCTWNLTKIMTKNLVEQLGDDGCFPQPRQIAAVDEPFLREKIKMGYRAPYLLEFARKTATGEFDLASVEAAGRSYPDLYKQVKTLKGFGHYAISNLMKLVGHYEHVGSDSWSRKKFAEKHGKKTDISEKEIDAFYLPFGRWAGLFFWMDVTEDWHRREDPWKNLS
jgi:3-methyladenine DNA glycosylase/8-oxoguanine DNA glycosylase